MICYWEQHAKACRTSPSPSSNIHYQMLVRMAHCPAKWTRESYVHLLNLACSTPAEDRHVGDVAVIYGHPWVEDRHRIAVRQPNERLRQHVTISDSAAWMGPSSPNSWYRAALRGRAGVARTHLSSRIRAWVGGLSIRAMFQTGRGIGRLPSRPM